MQSTTANTIAPLELPFKRPFDWARMLGFIGGRASAGVESVDGGEASRFANELADPHACSICMQTPSRSDTALRAIRCWLRSSPLLSVCAWSGFEFVVRTIIGQQVSVKGASTIMNRIVQRSGPRIDGHAHEGTAWRFSTPAELAADLDKIGMPGRRIETVQRFAQAVASGALSLDTPGADHEALKREMLAMPGIGPWTVGYVAMRALRAAMHGPTPISC